MTQPQELMTSSSYLIYCRPHTLACPPPVNQGQDGPWAWAPGSAGFLLRAKLEADPLAPASVTMMKRIQSNLEPHSWAGAQPDAEGWQGDLQVQLCQCLPLGLSEGNTLAAFHFSELHLGDSLSASWMAVLSPFHRQRTEAWNGRGELGIQSWEKNVPCPSHVCLLFSARVCWPRASQHR